MNERNYSLGQVGDHEIKQLKVFKMVVDCGGFSAAETMLNIGRSTISSHITNLEARLNLVLCKRGRGGFSLTEEGRVIYQMTENLLESLDSFRTTVNNLNSSLTGKLRIASSDNISLDPRCYFPRLIQDFSSTAPDVFINTNVSSMAKIERMVLNDEADIGFIPYHRKLEGLEYFHLYNDQCYLYCRQDHPLTTMNEADQDIHINTFPATHAGLKPHESISTKIANMNLKAVSYFYDSRLALILSGQFIGFLPEQYAQSYVDQEQIVSIKPQNNHYTLGIAVIYKKTNQPNKARELFLDILSRIFKETRSAPY
ncbi:LysR family transcriptional regulator [Marinomonas sp. C2222]|uniref:LysR family transcriptional regulator n=1 Tax=Marinomonas sargassi TaxID=2984494 RepID=A0ABT2YUI7_9GAMM|nr:LysR family transcriptional regulator [Marinomonas sargassi]MCV2403542.1 LysR family transcriptional regulator [Marinomonas sargassi]